MKQYLDINSLFQTIDNVSEAILFDLDIDNAEKEQIAEFIVNQHAKPTSYANTFAPTEADLKHDLILFTGEKIRSHTGKCHMIGEEASRILRKLHSKNDRVNLALQNADSSLSNFINEYIKYSQSEFGSYCCKSCSCGVWINMSSGGLNMKPGFLEAGMNYLKKHREKSGRWKGFPFYYTLYVLNEMDEKLAKHEMKHAARAIEKRLGKKIRENSKYELRRNFICEQILSKANSN